MRYFIGLVMISILALFMASCSEESNAKEPESVSVEKALPIRTVRLAPRDFSIYLEVTGTVEARNHIKIMAEESGTLMKILKDKGRYARQGDTLAVLENKVLAASYKQAKAALSQAELEFNSRKVLFEKRAISENEFLSAKYNLQAASAAYDLAKARYEKLFITAPLSGLVNDRYYDLGAFVNPMTPMFELIDNSYMKIRAGLAERFLGEIRPGTPVEIRFDAYPELVLQGKVTYVSRSINPRNRTFEIEVELPNPEGKLAPQMIANVRVLRQQFPKAIVAPLDALIESENGWYVFIEEQGRVKKTPVEYLAVQGDQVLVSGLKPGQHLVVVGQQELSDGDTVQVVSN